MLTEVRDCDLLIVVTSSTFLKRKFMLKGKEKNSWQGMEDVETQDGELKCALP